MKTIIVFLIFITLIEASKGLLQCLYKGKF